MTTETVSAIAQPAHLLSSSTVSLLNASRTSAPREFSPPTLRTLPWSTGEIRVLSVVSKTKDSADLVQPLLSDLPSSPTTPLRRESSSTPQMPISLSACPSTAQATGDSGVLAITSATEPGQDISSSFLACTACLPRQTTPTPLTKDQDTTTLAKTTELWTSQSTVWWAMEPSSHA